MKTDFLLGFYCSLLVAGEETESRTIYAEKDCRVSEIREYVPQKFYGRRVCPMEILDADDRWCLFAEVHEDEPDGLMEPCFPVFGGRRSQSQDT